MKKRGFTLIELLAVIVILAIIALIAVPIILNMIENARKSAAVDSAYGYIDSIEKNNALASVDSTKYTTISDGENIDINGINISLKGTVPTSGNVTIEKGLVTAAELCINNYKVSYGKGEAKVTSKCENDETVIQAAEVQFTPEDTNWEVDNVEDALNDLYDKAG